MKPETFARWKMDVGRRHQAIIGEIEQVENLLLRDRLKARSFWDAVRDVNDADMQRRSKRWEPALIGAGQRD